jgi:hypothetical protein
MWILTTQHILQKYRYEVEVLHSYLFVDIST